MDAELISVFRSAIQAAKPRPKGVKVTPDLFRALYRAGLIQYKGAPYAGFDTQPFFDGDVCLICDPGLETRADPLLYELPPLSR